MSTEKEKKGLDEQLIKHLEQPESYPHKPKRIKHLQTHISHAFIAPPYVYKIKKPVDFGFLDYSTLDKRSHYCKREVELNRRLCSDIYLGVIPIIQTDGGYFLENGESGYREGVVVEYAVKMKKLSGDHFLYAYIENDTLKQEHLDRVAAKLADFYLEQEPPEEVLEWGRIDKIRINTDENFDQTEPFIGQTIDRKAYRAVRQFTNAYLERHEPLFRRRIEEKRIVDGHGDLHLEHIHITPDRVCIYDCIEFNERFRYGDLASDLAYLAMDLDFRGCWKEERYFIDRMADLLEDSDLHRIIDFYKCYRAYVKGKVKSLQSSEEEVPKDQRRRSAEKASQYFDLSLKYALLGSRPTLLVLMGRVGTGKSTLAGCLGETLGIRSYSSDRIRKTLAGLPLSKRPSPSRREQLYSSDMSKKTYRKLRVNAARHLRNSESVILDATFSDRSSRRALIDELDDLDADYLFVEAVASDETIRSRLDERGNRDDVVSDARLEDFGMLDRRYDSPAEIDSSHRIAIDTEGTIDETIEDLYLKLADRHVNRPD